MRNEDKRHALLNKFIGDHPLLFALSPLIEIDEIESSYSSDRAETLDYDPPLLEIKVKHPFIFDNRLIPEEYQGIIVMNMTIGKLPKEFPEPSEEILLTEFYHVSRYRKFIKRCLPVIRKTLRKPEMSEEEALEALMW
jgi:hypothetical protein